MRVLILADMEGVSGIVHWDQVQAGTSMYQEGRRLYTEEINAAVRGAKTAGATQIVVVDSHGAGQAATMGGPAFNSLIPEMLDEACEFITHHGWGNIVEILEDGFEAAFFVGIHAMAGAHGGVLSHTVASATWRQMIINGVTVGEIGAIAALCGAFSVPMVLVTGDTAACDEARSLLGEGLTTVAVKKGLTRFSARNIAPVRARRMIEDAATGALRDLKRVKPYSPKSPVTVQFEIVTADKYDVYRGIEGVELQEPFTVVSRGRNFLEAWRRVAPFK